MAGLKKQAEKKKSTAEKHVSLSVLQQYFSGSLKDAAKSIGGRYPHIQANVFNMCTCKLKKMSY